MNRTFDRNVFFDPRSRDYPVRELLADKTPRSYTWSDRYHLDQGQDGACVGFAWAGELGCTPVVVPVSDADGERLYHQARTLDDTPGEDYEGTSVLAGAKAVQVDGYLRSYTWAFSIDDLILAIGYQGPAVLGVSWYEGMMTTDDRGFVYPTGDVVGGHAILCRGVSIHRGYFTLRNSWGPDWGVYGDCRIRIDDLAFLLGDQGEACIPHQRMKPTTPVQG